MILNVQITNVYGDEEITSTEHIDVPTAPLSDSDDLEDWADEHLLPLTGTGRTEGEAGYFVEVLSAPDQPELVGREFEWFG